MPFHKNYTFAPMAETLGMLCDKLTIAKLKQYHSTDEARLESLQKQSMQLQHEVDKSRLTFHANIFFKAAGNEVNEVLRNFGEVFYQLADVNCRL